MAYEIGKASIYLNFGVRHDFCVGSLARPRRAVAGIFGMSEAGVLVSNGEPTGFWLTTGVIVVAAIVAAVFLRRIDWI